jgi:cytochrome c oxidase subunit II
VSILLSPTPAASVFAGKVDSLLWTLTAVTGLVAVAIVSLMIIFSVRYRRATTVDRRISDATTGVGNHWLEATWICVPLAIFVGFYFWGARLYFDYETPPPAPLEFDVVAKQWMWKLEQPNGRREINELHVPRGRPIKLILSSQDVIHSFYVPAFRVKRDVVPGRFAILWFTPTITGRYHLFCAEYCGTNHSHMGGDIVVMEPQAYSQWLSRGPAQPTLAQQGSALFRQLGCSGCHTPGAAIHAPDLNGLYGRTVPLSDGRFVKVDEQYVRDSILQPSRNIAAGYRDDMPSFAGQVSEEDLLELVSYIKSLAPAEAAPEGGSP